jgi:hypothetical protein
MGRRQAPLTNGIVQPAPAFRLFRVGSN